jgi:predicted enzyme related to lactoylglutathione lyase
MSERTSYAPGTPSWVDLTTPDLNGALRFYGGVLGWQFEDAGEEAGHYHQALVNGKRVAGIGPSQPGGPPMAVWTTYLSGSDVDAHAAAIRAGGGQVVVEPLEIFDQGRMLVGQDPGGAMFGIWEPRAHHGSELVNENAAPSWNELYTHDLDAAERFYGSLFAYDFEPLPDVEYRMLKVGGDVVAGVLKIGPPVPEGTPPMWLNYFHLDDVDAGFQRVKELGGELLTEPRDSPYGRLAVVRDPQGGVFSLIRSAFQV